MTAVPAQTISQLEVSLWAHAPHLRCPWALAWKRILPAPASHKATFGYHVYDHAQAADLLGEPLYQLRSRREREEPATDEFAHLCEAVWRLQTPIERLVAVYRVLEPHLVSTYVYHADATDPLTDTPTVRLLRQLASMDQSHVAWGQAVIESLTASPADRKRALEVQADVEEQLVVCGGVTGEGIESHWLTFHSARAEGRGKSRRTRGKTGYRFLKRSAPLEHPTVEAPFWFSDRPEDFEKAYHADDEWSLEGFRHKFHQLLYGEVERDAITAHQGTTRIHDAGGFCLSQLHGGAQIRMAPQADIALTIQRVEDGAALHLIHYGYDKQQDSVLPLPELTLDIRLPERFDALEIHAPGNAPRGTLTLVDDMHRISLQHVPLYSILVLRKEERSRS